MRPPVLLALHLPMASCSNRQTAQCPICKAHISSSSLVPLYGRGNSPTSNEPGSELKRAHQSELVIPNRPSAPGGSVLHLNQQIHPVPFQAQPQLHPHSFGSYAFGPSNLVGAVTPTSFSNPIVGMVGEMVWGIIFRSSDSGFFTAYPYGSYQNPYPVSGTSSPRVRRQFFLQLYSLDSTGLCRKYMQSHDELLI
ncbi:hypothetical protein L1987_55601 [Smallanthus sonchifolius]|uniref:Uncharacterized protein n=1 Tax=Smallanthus sonchifolius TaxID=185202 RepID=A0ACB9EAU1_9ASTR|nr:hypothetical protein L1987_55601 [Smallanthus sonchifolius]